MTKLIAAAAAAVSVTVCKVHPQQFLTKGWVRMLFEIDAIRVVGGMLLVALYMQIKKEAHQLDATEVQQERKRLLDAHVLRSVLAQ